MKLLSKLFKKRDAVFVEGFGDFDQEVVGESNCQKHLSKVCGGYTKQGARKNEIAELHYENNNRFDDKAIRVEIIGKPVGCLSREDARLYWKRIAMTGHEGIVIRCHAVIVGGKK